MARQSRRHWVRFALVGCLMLILAAGAWYASGPQRALRTTITETVFPQYQNGWQQLQAAEYEEAAASFAAAAASLDAVPLTDAQVRQYRTPLVFLEAVSHKRAVLMQWQALVEEAMRTNADTVTEEETKPLYDKISSVIDTFDQLPDERSWAQLLHEANARQWRIFIGIQANVSLNELRADYDAGLARAQEAVTAARAAGDREGLHLSLQTLEYFTRGDSFEDFVAQQRQQRQQQGQQGSQQQQQQGQQGSQQGQQQQSGQQQSQQQGQQSGQGQGQQQGQQPGPPGLAWMTSMQPSQLPSVGLPMPFGLTQQKEPQAGAGQGEGKQKKQ